MISDVLSEAVDELRYYLAEPTFKKVYAGDFRKRIERLVKEMDTMRVELGTPPPDKD